MSLQDKIIIELDGELFEHLQHRTQMILRGNPQAGDRMVITERDRIVLDRFFEEWKIEFLNRNALVAQAALHEGNALILNLTPEQVEAELYKYAELIRQILIEYLLMRWLDGLNMLELSNYRRIVYEKLLTEYKTKTTGKAFVVPKYRPYW